MSRNQSEMPLILEPCRSDGYEQQKRSIDLSTSIIIAILNIVEIVMIAKLKRKKKIYELVLLSLSVSDCMFCLINVIVSSIFLHQACQEYLLEAAYVLYVFFIMTSTLHLILIALDRVMIVLIPVGYKSKVTTKRIRSGIAVIWILALTISATVYLSYELTLPEPFVRRHKRSIPTNDTIIMTSTLTPSLLPQPFHIHAQRVLSICIVTLDLIMILCYSTIIYQMSFKHKKVISNKSSQNHRLPILCVIIVIVFAIFTLPYAIARFYLGHVPFWANYVLIWNSGMNSIVYFFRSKIEKQQRRKTPKDKNWTKGTCDIINTQ